jgi:hypothetical protein
MIRSPLPFASLLACLPLLAGACDGAPPDDVDTSAEAQSTRSHVVFQNDFNTNDLTMIGMDFVADTFRGTHQPAYSSGAFGPGAGFHGTGAIEVNLGDQDDNHVVGMSGGWRRAFTLAAKAHVTVSFHYLLVETPNYEPDEFTDVLVSIDGKLVGQGSKDFVARLFGDGQGGPLVSTGWHKATLPVGALAEGDHLFVIGSFNNKKTATDESSTTTIDDVLVTAQP